MWPRLLIIVLAAAIGMQNTCPQGWASKTAFVTCRASHCPMKEQRPVKSKGDTGTGKNMPIVQQTFELNIARMDCSMQALAVIDQATPTDTSDVKEIFVDPIFRPPISSLS